MFLSVGLGVVACLTPAALPSNAPPASPGKAIIHTVQFSGAIGSGAARLVVKYSTIDPAWDPRRSVIRLLDGAGQATDVPADGAEHLVEVPVSYPQAARIKVDGVTILAMLRAGPSEAVYFLGYSDCAKWSLVSGRTDPVLDTGPNVVCGRRSSGCPDGYEESRGPPVNLERRCRVAGRRSAILCYRPGTVRFRSVRAARISLVEYTHVGQHEIRSIDIVAGRPSDAIPAPYSACPPVSFKLNQQEFYLAVEHGESWLVDIAADGEVRAVADAAKTERAKGKGDRPLSEPDRRKSVPRPIP